MTPSATTAELERHLAGRPGSPLFALLAERLLRDGEVARALDLCERGLAEHPRYATGRLVQARCFAARGQYDAALGAISAVLSRYPGNISLEAVEESWRELQVVTAAPPGAVATVATDTEMVATDTETVATDTEMIATDTETVATDTEAPPADRDRSPDAPAPAGAGAPVAPAAGPPPARVPSVQGDRIVSGTLAEIYARQGAIGEAVETYRLLLARLPGRRAEIESRLRELEERLRADSGAGTAGRAG